MHEQYSDALAALADGTLGPEDRTRLEAHLETCRECRQALADLRRVEELAGGLERHAPPERVWREIAAALETEGAVGSRSRSWRGAWWAAAAALVLMAAATVWLWRGGAPGDQGPSPAPESRMASVETELRLAEEHYERAIAGLEEMAALEEELLEPEVAAALRQSLVVIDEAIEESRAALRARPQSVTARETLFEALRRKVGLLQDTIALVNEMRKGNQAEAARIVEGLSES